MKPVFQSKFGLPRNDNDNDSEFLGNCTQASIASILELDIEDVPHIVCMGTNADDWHEPFNRWLASLGLYVIYMDPTWFDISYMRYDGLCLLAGKTDRDSSHIIVGRIDYKEDGSHEFIHVHDPYPDGNGLIKVESVWLFCIMDPAKRLK